LKKYIDLIHEASDVDEVCNQLHIAICSLRDMRYLNDLPDGYDDIDAGTPEDVESWFDIMKDDSRAREEGNLREIYGLFDAALRRLRKLGFHRKYD
jgi:hypothetical protein